MSRIDESPIELVFQSIFSDTKSFAEEVAEALCERAEAIRKTHPSVVIGRDRRLIEGLLDVAAFIRENDCQKKGDEQDCKTYKSDLETDSQISIQTEEPTTPDLQKGPSEIRNSPEWKRNLLNTPEFIGNRGNKEIPMHQDKKDLITPSTSHRKSALMHVRQAFGDSASKDSTCEINTDRQEGSVINASNTEKGRVAFSGKSNRGSFLRMKKESIIKFIRPSSNSSSPTRIRIGKSTRKSSFKKLKKRFHSAYSSSLKTAENGFNRLKLNFATSFAK